MHSLHSLSSKGTTPRTTQRFRSRLKRYLKVRLIYLTLSIEKKTLVFDIDETLVYSTRS